MLDHGTSFTESGFPPHSTTHIRAFRRSSMHLCESRADTPSALNIRDSSQSFYTMLITVPICKPIHIVSCYKFIKIFQISSTVNSGTCHISELHRLTGPAGESRFLVCVLSVLAPPCNLSCCGAKVKKRVSSFTTICITALHLFENSFIFSLLFLCA